MLGNCDLSSTWMEYVRSYRPSAGPGLASTPGVVMIVLGLILAIIGFITSIQILWILGIILLVVGAVFAILGSTGRAVGGRQHWY